MLDYGLTSILSKMLVFTTIDIKQIMVYDMVNNSSLFTIDERMMRMSASMNDGSLS